VIVFDEDFTLLSRSEVAAELGVSVSKVHRLAGAGVLAGVHHGGRWMVSTDEVERFRRTWVPPHPRGGGWNRGHRGQVRQFRPADRPKAG
jgi:excisionase family DNA binding protein